MADSSLNIPMKELKAFTKTNVPNPLFVVLTGSHAYGFPSADSDYDLRGSYIAKTKELLALRKPVQVLERKEGKIELIINELDKFLFQMLTPNGYIIEQINSPYPVAESKAFKQLKLLSKNVICKALHNHYADFALSVYKKAHTSNWADIKEDLYLLRVLMTGITMLETGKVIVNLPELNKKFNFDVVPQLIELKAQSNDAKGMINLDKESSELFTRLDEAYKNSSLPEHVQNIEKFNDFILKIRLANMK